MSDEKMRALVSGLVNYLDCPCTYFAPMIDDDPLMEAYEKAREESVQSKDFVPVFVVPSDTLLETLVMNSDPTNEGRVYDFDKDEIAEYRRGILETDPNNGEEAIQNLLSITQEVLGDPSVFEDMINQSGGNTEAEDRIMTWWDFDSTMTNHIILARIPVEKVYEIFAWLPMGGWNACPNNEDLKVISKLWFEKYGARPVVVSADGIDFMLDEPVAASEAKDLAIKHYAFCPDLLEDREGVTISSYAEILAKSKIWNFWWDQLMGLVIPFTRNRS